MDDVIERKTTASVESRFARVSQIGTARRKVFCDLRLNENCLMLVHAAAVLAPQGAKTLDQSFLMLSRWRINPSSMGIGFSNHKMPSCRKQRCAPRPQRTTLSQVSWFVPRNREWLSSMAHDSNSTKSDRSCAGVSSMELESNRL
jgi:hypothetical protein